MARKRWFDLEHGYTPDSFALNLDWVREDTDIGCYSVSVQVGFWYLTLRWGYRGT